MRKKNTDTLRQLSSPPVLNPHAVYTRLQATALLGLKPSTLATEIRKGRLRVSRRAGRYFILGAWLLQWIRAGERKRSSRGEAKGVEACIEPCIKSAKIGVAVSNVKEDKEL
jgi:hypothetical protein